MARMRLMTRRGAVRLGVLFAVIAAVLGWAWWSMVVMPGSSHRGPLPPATPDQVALTAELRDAVMVLADAEGGVGRAGNRSMFYPRRFAQAAAWIHDRLTSFGYAEVREYPVERGSPTPNLEVTVPGATRPGEIVVVGAHYDAFQGTPGADDNASGVAACLWLARVLRGQRMDRTVRIVFFVNEEPPSFWTRDMGSWVYARACRERGDGIVAMLSLESIGYYSDQPGSQRYPAPLNLLYPDTGDFIAFVSNFGSRGLNRRAVRVFRGTTAFPCEGGSPPGVLPGVGWSDHWAFWQEGYDAIMVTDTAVFRNPNYHTPADTADRLDYDRMARVAEGVRRVIEDLAKDGSSR
jgi:hypothetical protein